MENNLEKQISEKKTKKKISKSWKIVIVAVVIIPVAFFIFVLTLDAPKGSQEDWISKFSAEDLEKLNLQYNKVNIPTRTTPEQTYAALKEALKNEDVEAATNCFVEEKRGEWRDIFEKAGKNKDLKGMGEVLPEKISKVYINDVIAQFEAPQFVDGHNTSHTFEFTKDSNGDWKIESL